MPEPPGTMGPPICRRCTGLPREDFKPTVIVFDLDGTLNVAVPGLRFDWTNKEHCNHALMLHPPALEMIDLCNHLWKSVKVIIATARPDTYREVTQQWLYHHGVNYSELIMRKEGDQRPDREAKRDMIKEMKAQYRIWFAVEDRSTVVAMWREEGIICLQCVDGNY